jgi:hypothetical protein
MWERDLLVHTIEKALATPLCQLLLQKHVTLLVISDGGAINDYAISVGYWALTMKLCVNAKA